GERADGTVAPWRGGAGSDHQEVPRLPERSSDRCAPLRFLHTTAGLTCSRQHPYTDRGHYGSAIIEAGCYGRPVAVLAAAVPLSERPGVDLCHRFPDRDQSVPAVAGRARLATRPDLREAGPVSCDAEPVLPVSERPRVRDRGVARPGAGGAGVHGDFGPVHTLVFHVGLGCFMGHLSLVRQCWADFLRVWMGVDAARGRVPDDIPG